nr:MAG: RNA-dependent RNA polymerase [Mitovirus sp.]
MKLRNIIPISNMVRGAAFNWQTTVKGGRALGAALTRVLHLRDGGITSRWYTATMEFGRYVVRMQRSCGWAYVVKYLKACSVLLQQASGGQRIEATQALGVAVRRTKGSGIPRVIPAVMRKSIRSGDPWTIRIWLSFFQLYRVIEIPGKLKLQSITDGSAMRPNFLKGWILFLNDWLPVLFREIGENQSATLWMQRRSSCVSVRNANYDAIGEKYSLSEIINFVHELAASWITFKWEGIPCNLKPRLLALFKSGPNSGGVHVNSWIDGRKKSKRLPNGKLVPNLTGTNTSAIFTDAMQWQAFKLFEEESWGFPFHLYVDLYPVLLEWLDIVGDDVISRILFVAKRVALSVHRKVEEGDYNSFKYPGFGRPKGLGKLGYKVEPAGKVRVFAMVDSLTQCIMKPLHDLLFRFLGKLRTDGTFNQIRPAQRLIDLGYREFYSYDLSSATDRFPLALQQVMLSAIIGPKLAKLWAKILVERYYLTPQAPDGVSGPNADTPLVYGAGQPMGALTSWAAFSLCHHCLVQYAAYRATGFIGFFDEYALLGDDIVIANYKVAQEYLALLREIGVEYGLAKSLISSTGGFEFAKRTFAKGKDVSGVSLLAIGVAKADHSVLEQILSRFGVSGTLMETLRKASKVLGYGHRAIARLPAVLKSRSRLQGLAILLSRPGSPWGLAVMQWLLQWNTGEVREVPQEVLLAIGERLFNSLRDKARYQIVRMREKLETVIYPDSAYGGNIDTWFDEDNIQAEAWNIYVVLPLVGQLKIDLKDLQERLDSLEEPSLDDLNEIWACVEEIRDAIAALPSPNFFERTRNEFGGAKRSALIKVFRSAQAWLHTESVRKMTERCLPIKGMAMAVSEGPLVPVMVSEELIPMEPEGAQESENSWNPGPTAQFSQMNPNGDGIWTELIQVRDGSIAPLFTYQVKGVVFTENDIHLDGIYHREDLSYVLALDLLPPEAKARVEERLREEQYDEM